MGNKNTAFWFIFAYVIAMFIWTLYTPKGDEILYIYKNTNHEITLFFSYLTYLGEWIGMALLGLYLLIKDRKGLVLALIGFVPTDLVLIMTKKFLDAPRPLKSFLAYSIKPLPEVTPLYGQSMPSGHTFTAFFLATFCCFYFDLPRWVQLLLILLAIGVGWSRMMLLHHFKEDVLAGSILGIIGGLIPFLITMNRPKAS